MAYATQINGSETRTPMKTKRRIASALLALAAVGSMFVAGNTTAGATEGGQSSDIASDVFGQPLDEFLADYPNAERRADGAYDLEPGALLMPPNWAPEGGAVVQEWPSGCPDHHYCIYQHREFGGWGLAYYYCGTYTVSYRNATSSMHNAQNSPSAFFWDIDPSPDVQGALGAGGYLRDLAQDTAPDGRSWNDRIDRVRPC